MSKTQWEYDLVDRPFCEHLKAMGWQWIEDAADGAGTGMLIDSVHQSAAA